VSATDNQSGYRPPAKPLTQSQVNAAKHKPDIYRMSDGKGLYLEVSPRQKAWMVAYTVRGKHHTKILGKHPAMSLKEARLARELLRHDVSMGADPVAEAKAAKQERQESNARTVQGEALEWHASNIGSGNWSTSYATQTMQRLTAHVFPAIGQMPVAGVRPRDILPMLRAAETKSGKHQADNVRMHLVALFDTLVIAGLVEINPASGLRKAIRLPASEKQPAVGTIEEARDVLRRFETSNCSAMLKLLHRFGALTGLRPTEVRCARWDEIDGSVWRIPAGRMKGAQGKKKAHTVFLSPQAMDVLEAARSVAPAGAVYVFPGHVERAHQPYGRVTLPRQLALVLGKGVHVAHGWRATMVTITGEHSDHPQADALLQAMIAHRVQDGVATLYNRTHQARNERKIRPLAELWADLLLPPGSPSAHSLLGNRKPSNIVQLREAA